MLEILLYGFLVVYALHLLVALVIYIIVGHQEDKKAREEAAHLAWQKNQEELWKIEMRRQQREREYYERLAAEQATKKNRAFAPTTVMPLCPPPPPRKKP